MEKPEEVDSVPEVDEKEKPTAEKRAGGELFIVDNSDSDWKVREYLHEWADVADRFDVATGYFEIGALLALDGQWQKLEKLRILMGDQVSKRTRKALLAGIEAAKTVLDDSIEKEKETNDFLQGVPAIVEAIAKRQIECKIYTKDKFHAKAYITHAKQAVIGSSALVGSSNFTYPGLTTNVELNIQIRREVELLQKWFEEHWNEAEPISDDVLRVIERHIHEYSPFDVYAKSLHEFYRGHEMTIGEWELEKSQVYPILDQYQKDGYRALMKIAKNYGGALLCDGVGLGKTFIGLMVIERLLHDRKKVALFVPKSARKPVWEEELRTYLPDAYGDFSNLAVYNHTDLLRGDEWEERMNKVARMVDAIVIDEAHHFRNQAADRSRKLFEMAEGKQLYLLTATPINNKLRDLQHIIELFSRKESAYFKEAPLGIHSLPGHFRKMEKALEKVIDGNPYDAGGITLKEAEEVLSKDDLFRALVVQRSRAYVRQSQKQHRGREILFPKRQPPKIVGYSLTKTYGTLLDRIEKAMSRNRPLLTLGVYYPLAYYIGEDEKIDPMEEGRQKQVVGLIRTQLLKRFESSAVSFQSTCEALMLKLLAFVLKHEPSDSEHWQASHGDLIQRIRDHQVERGVIEEDDYEEDVIPEEMLERFEDLKPKDYDISKIIKDTLLDLDLLAEFLEELKGFSPKNDDKLRALVSVLKRNARLKRQKVLIFSEYKDTARYLGHELQARGIGPLQEVDSGTKKDRGEIIKAFAPYYNKLLAADIDRLGDDEVRILVSTDVLSEGLNLQDASCIINYDLHWNPVRLMQRIGRVDRRLDRTIENRIAKDCPEQIDVPRQVHIWNFLPPDELDRLLNLYNKVSKKTLRISKVFGIEGKKLIKPSDDYDALKDFDHAYEGDVTSTEKMFLEYQRLLKNNPGLAESLDGLPLKLFSGKSHPIEDTSAVFLCYSLPARDAETSEWTREAGHCRWYLYDCESEDIEEDPSAMVDLIRSTTRTARRVSMTHETLSEIRRKIDKHIKNTYFKRGQAPVGVKGTLMAWMELC